jgi:hypothetical protein
MADQPPESSMRPRSQAARLRACSAARRLLKHKPLRQRFCHPRAGHACRMDGMWKQTGSASEPVPAVSN